jgi:hypothetical protein
VRVEAAQLIAEILMRAIISITAKILAGLFVFIVVLAFLDDLPRWVIFALIGLVLHLWMKCDKWSIRYMQKAGYEEWSKVSAEIN